MDYLTVFEAIEESKSDKKYDPSHVRLLCRKGKIKGAIQKGKIWLIPRGALDDYEPGPQGFAAHPRKKSKN